MSKGRSHRLNSKIANVLVNPGSWSGSTRTKRILRSLWACGELVTHHRKGGRHYYDRPSRVIPEQHFMLPPLVDEAAYYRWIILRRYKAAGVLRPTAEAAIWSACDEAPKRKRALAELVEEGSLTQLQIGELAGSYYTPTSALTLLDEALPIPRVIFMGPLDSMLWDRNREFPTLFTCGQGMLRRKRGCINKTSYI